MDFDYVGLRTGSQIKLQSQRVAAELDKDRRCRMKVHLRRPCGDGPGGNGNRHAAAVDGRLFAKAFGIRMVTIVVPWTQGKHAILIRSYDALQAAGGA